MIILRTGAVQVRSATISPACSPLPPSVTCLPRLAAFLTFTSFLTGVVAAQPSLTQHNLIDPVLLRAGQPDTLHVSDLFYATDYPVAFDSTPAVSATYLADDALLLLHPQGSHVGLDVVPFTYGDDLYQLLTRTVEQQLVAFRYAPSDPPRNAFVFGSFNDWDRNRTPLTDDDRDGIYTAEILVEPGRYEYKFFVDGEEVVDAANPDSVANPFGAYNSVVTVAPRFDERVHLHHLAHKRLPEGIQLSFLYDGPAPLKPDQVLALLGNAAFPPDGIDIQGHRLDLSLPDSLLAGWTVVRAAVAGDGPSTPVQTVRLYDGMPAGFAGSPDTWHDTILYSLMVDRFYDGDPRNTRLSDHPDVLPKANYWGGDLLGVLAKMEEGYFDSLGVNTLWLSPLNQNTWGTYQEYPPPHRYYTAYHGYWPIHHQQVDKRLGDMDLLRTLIDRAHERGIRVLLDFVANHVHEEHPFYQENPEWFGTYLLPDSTLNLRLWDEYRLTTWFDTFLPSFDYEESDEALQVMTDNVVWWLEATGADGFRHDAVKHIPNRFWRTQTRKIVEQVDLPRGRPSFQIGETFGSYDLIASYVSNGQLDAQFNFNLYDAAHSVFLSPQSTFAQLDDEQQRTFAVYGTNHLMGNLMDSHDKVRYLALADGDLTLSTPNPAEVVWSNPPQVDDPQSYRKAQLYLAWMLTIPGVPVIYYGDEIGITGAADPDNRRPMRFDDAVRPDERAHFERVRQLIALRRHHPALRYGDFLTLQADSDVYAYLRSDASERILVVLNKNPDPTSVFTTLPGMYGITHAIDAVTGEFHPVEDNMLEVEVEGTGWAVIELR